MIRIVSIRAVHAIFSFHYIVAALSLQTEHDGDYRLKPRGPRPPSPLPPAFTQAWQSPLGQQTPVEESLAPPFLEELHKEELAQRKAIVNLDKPPSERWKDVILDYRTELIPYFRKWNRVIASMTEKVVTRQLMAAVEKKMPVELFEEAYSIVKHANSTEVSDVGVLLLSVMYEIGLPMMNTELLLASKSGSVLHGHNLDKPVVAPVVEVTFTRWGKILYTAPVCLGNVGIHTGVKPGQWSFSQVSWSNGEDTPESILRHLSMKGEISSIFMRQLMEKANSYDEVLEQLQAKPLARAQKFVVAGPKPYEGVIISRAATPDHAKLNIESLSDGKKRLVVQSEKLEQQAPAKPAPAKPAPAKPAPAKPAPAKPFAMAFKPQPPSPPSPPSLTVNDLVVDHANLMPSKLLDIMAKAPLHTDNTVYTFLMVPKSGSCCSKYPPGVVRSEEDACGTMDAQWEGRRPESVRKLVFHAAVRPPSSWGIGVKPTAPPEVARLPRAPVANAPVTPQGPHTGVWMDPHWSPALHVPST